MIFSDLQYLKVNHFSMEIPSHPAIGWGNLPMLPKPAVGVGKAQRSETLENFQAAPQIAYEWTF